MIRALHTTPEKTTPSNAISKSPIFSLTGKCLKRFSIMMLKHSMALSSIRTM